MSDWKVNYEIDGEEYQAVIPDGSDPVGSHPRYIGPDEKAFEQYIEDNHPGVKLEDVVDGPAVPLDHPLASYF